MLPFKSVIDTCVPRPEIKSGDLSFDLFAAKLRLVVEGKAPQIYQSAEDFFRNTFVTEGLEELIREVFSRLTGTGVGSPVIRLETSFGGGKTHDEIALWHIAKQGRSLLREDDRFDRLLAMIPEGTIQVAAIDGRDLSPQEGIYHEETGLTTKTIWGEIAYQLGGVEGYQLLKGSDELGISPGSAVIDRLIGPKPTLIILDEIARYFRSAKAKVVESSNLAEQVVAFLFSLMDCAASCNNLVFVYSLASSADTFGEETAELMRELRSASARQERILRPSNDVEIYSIVKQRMFDSISLKAAEKVADLYFDTYRASHNNLPDRCKESNYKEAIAKSYPFHPELFNLLTNKIASIPEFQRTRGALRLFAQVVQYLWQHPSPYMPLIHPHHLPLGIHTEITTELTSRLDRALMDLAIKADIHNDQGISAHAQTQDQEWRDRGKPPFSSWVARTIFLHSVTQGITAGISNAELHLSLLMPQLETGFIGQAVKNLLDVAWHLDFDPVTNIYQFKEEPSLNKIIAQEKEQVSITIAKEELRTRRDSIFARKFFDCIIAPEGSYDVEDRSDSIALCLIDFDEATLQDSTDAVPLIVQKIFHGTGESATFRNFKNRLLFLVPNKQGLDRALSLAKEFIAIKAIRSSPRRLEELSNTQQKDLKAREGILDLNVRVALTNAYRHLFYPSEDKIKAPKGLMHYPLPTEDSSTVKGKNNQQEVILKALKDCNKIRGDEAKPYASAFILQKVWPVGMDHWTTKALREAFARGIEHKMLLEGELSQLRDTIKTGVEEGAWDLKLGKQVFIKQPNQTLVLPTIAFSEQLELYRRGILKPPEPRIIEFDIQTISIREKEKTVRLRWRAKGAIAVALYQENELIRDDYPPSGDGELTIATTTTFRVVVNYGEEETAETSKTVDCASTETGTGGDRGGDGTDIKEPLLFRPTEITKDGSINKTFTELSDQITDTNVKTISVLAITVNSLQDYRKLSTAIGFLTSYKPQIEQSITLQSQGQFIRLEYQGDYRGYQGFANPINTLLNTQEIQGDAMLTIRLEFEPAMAVADGTLEKIKNVLSNNPVERLGLMAQVGYDD